MQIILGQIVGQHPQTGAFIVNPSLVKLAAMDLPSKQAYWLKRIVKAAESEVRQAEEVRVQLVKKYGEEGEGGIIVVNTENTEAFTGELNEMLEAEIDLPGDGVTLESLGDIKLSAIDLMKLDWLITDEAKAATAGA